MSAQLSLVVTAVDRASSTLNNIDKSANSLGKTFATVGKVAAVGAAVGIGVAVTAGIKFVQAAAEEEAGIKRLATAVDAAGGNWAAHGKEIEKVISQRQKLAFADDVLRDSLSILVAQTGSAEEALKRQAIAMDFSRGAGIDLVTASKLLGKVTDENVNVLARYGIRATEGMDATELLANVQQRFSGQSAAYASTAAGKWDRFNIALDNIKETIGAALLPLVTRLADRAATFLEEHQEDIERISQEWSRWAEEALPKIERFVTKSVIPILSRAFKELKGIIETLTPVIQPILKFFQDNEVAIYVLIAALAGLAIALGGPVTAIIGIITVGTLLLAHWDEIKAKGVEVWDAIERKVRGIPILGAIIEDTFNTIKILIESYVRTYIAIIEYLFATIRNVFAIFKAVWEGDWDAFWEAIKNQFAATVNLFDDIFGIALDAIRGTFNSKAGMLVEVGSDIANSIWGPLKTGAIGVINFIIGKLNWFIRQFNSVSGFFGGIIGRDLTIDQLGYIGEGSQAGGGSAIGFAKGGIVTRPTLAMIGEAGPEAVIPLSRGAMGGDVHLHIHTPFNLTNPADQERAALQIAQLVRRQMRFA